MRSSPARPSTGARDFFNAAAPFATGSVDVNVLSADESDRVRAAYGPNFDRLARLKRRTTRTTCFA